MTLKELLAKAEQLENQADASGGAMLARWGQMRDLVPDLAQRLRSAVETLEKIAHPKYEIGVDVEPMLAEGVMDQRKMAHDALARICEDRKE